MGSLVSPSLLSPPHTNITTISIVFIPEPHVIRSVYTFIHQLNVYLLLPFPASLVRFLQALCPSFFVLTLDRIALWKTAPRGNIY